MEIGPHLGGYILLLFAVVNMSLIHITIFGCIIVIVIFVVFCGRTYYIQVLFTSNLSDLISEFHFIVMFGTVD